jgi:predicted membrane chloride channel (bestrophin family)
VYIGYTSSSITKTKTSLLKLDDVYYTMDYIDNESTTGSYSRNRKQAKGTHSNTAAAAAATLRENDGDDDHHVEAHVTSSSSSSSSIHQKILDQIRQRILRMQQGRGTEEIIMREAEALGGLPRNDRYSSRDWFHNTISLPQSVVLYNIRSPVIAVTSWATFLSIVHHHLLQTAAATTTTTQFFTASQLYISSVPHSLMMSALGLLLVFRTNAAYQRFAEGRVIWERIVNIARDLSRMTLLYETYIGIDKRRRIQRLVVAFPYLLRHRIRPNLVMRRIDDESYQRDPDNTILLYPDTGMKDNDPEAASLAQAEEVMGISRRKIRPLYFVDKRTLPWRLLSDNDALEKCARAQNRPLWVCDRLAAEIGTVLDTPMYFTSRERLQLLKHVNALSKCIGSAERIQTSVPLKYARHTLRALTLWLFSLPFCVLQDLKLVTGPMLFLVSWLLFGVYEIGYAIEDPFQGTLRLSILCETIRRDVLGDETIRKSAFDLNSSAHISDDDREDMENDSYNITNGSSLNTPDVNQ